MPTTSVEEGARDTFSAQHWGGRGITVSLQAAQPGVPLVGELARAIFGRALMPGEWASLTGAPDHANVTVTADLQDGRQIAIIRVTHHWYEVQQFRVVYRDDAGEIAIRNEVFRVRETAPEGVATRVLAYQVRAAEAFGIGYVSLDAAGGPGSPFNGYYTWSRLGFDGPIPTGVRRKLARLPVDHPFQRALTVQDLLELPGGREWWRANGAEFPGIFDVLPRSRSRDVLAAYTRARAIRI